MVVMAPSDENETRRLLSTGFHHHGPAAVRYPRGTGPGAQIDPSLEPVEIGRGVRRRAGHEVGILAFGTLFTPALAAASALDASIADMRFVKPLDEELILEFAAAHSLLVTVEENAIAGGAGAAVAEFLAERGLVMPVLHLGLPDRFLEHGKPQDMLRGAGLDAAGLEASIRARMKTLRIARQAAR
jgi:1-deoxy-D-xylulose-5-phosphate synthase